MNIKQIFKGSSKEPPFFFGCHKAALTRVKAFFYDVIDAAPMDCHQSHGGNDIN
ncbi:hypothetical protein PS850_02593 [Pseudomonas fluorescens]|nr:hypothetical protein PS850_02593 [Pseudomonas fluorescens]